MARPISSVVERVTRTSAHMMRSVVQSSHWACRNGRKSFLQSTVSRSIVHFTAVFLSSIESAYDDDFAGT